MLHDKNSLQARTSYGEIVYMVFAGVVAVFGQLLEKSAPHEPHNFHIQI